MTRLRLFSALLASSSLVSVSAAHAQRPTTAAADLPVEALTRRVLADLVGVNTTVSQGSTTPAVTMLAARFKAAGWPAADVIVAGKGPKSRNLVVIWRGKPPVGAVRAKPVLFNAHLDVVEAEPSLWHSDPFRLVERDGYLYGRGVLDDKGPAAALVAAFISARRDGVTPIRDLILTLTAGEESGVENGFEWLLDNRPDVRGAEYVVNLDGGGADVVDGTVRAFTVQAAEKVYLDVELTASGPGGHSSTPSGPTPIDALARALSRLTGHQFPVNMLPVTRTYLARRGALTPGELGAAMQQLAANADDSTALATVLRDPLLSSRLRTTCLATMLRAGTAPNAIPASATANVNCRVIPGESQASVLARLRSVVADSAIAFKVISPMQDSPASTPPAWFEALVADAVRPDHGTVPVIPYMETGATDGVYSRNRGIPTYGVAGFFIPEADLDRMHANDERISVRGLALMANYTRRLVQGIAARR